ncbi:MAG: DUF924 family protein [Aeromonas sp.]
MQSWQPLLDLWFGGLAQAAAKQGGTPAQAIFAGFARCHRVIIECAGRLPHRNDIPGCISRPEEVAFLQ